jgi:hypothetical protein
VRRADLHRVAACAILRHIHPHNDPQHEADTHDDDGGEVEHVPKVGKVVADVLLHPELIDLLDATPKMVRPEHELQDRRQACVGQVGVHDAKPPRPRPRIAKNEGLRAAEDDQVESDLHRVEDGVREELDAWNEPKVAQQLILAQDPVRHARFRGVLGWPLEVLLVPVFASVVVVVVVVVVVGVALHLVHLDQGGEERREQAEGEQAHKIDEHL